MSDIETTQTRLPVITEEILLNLTQGQAAALDGCFNLINRQFAAQVPGTDTRFSIAAQVWDHGASRGRDPEEYTGEYGMIVVVCIPRERAFLVSPEGYKQVKADRAERDALRAVLTEILSQFNNTYDVDTGTTGPWTAAASIPVEVMERAERLVSK